MSNAHPNEDGTTTSNGSFGIFSPKKTVDEAKLKEIITGELAKFLADSPKPGDTTKPGCKKAEVKDYSEGIKKVVDEIEASKYEERVTGGETTDQGKKSFLRIFTHYKWNTAILRQINPGMKSDFTLTEEQTKRVFGDGAKPEMTAVGPPPVEDEHGNISYPGEASITFHAKDVSKFDRAAMTKIITDKVSEFLAKNPQEVCEGGNDNKPGNDTKPGDNTKPGNETKPGTTEPATPGNDTKPGDTTKPGDNTKPGIDTKPGTTTKPDTKPADTAGDTPGRATRDNKPGGSSATDGDNKSVNGAATASGEGSQTVLEKPANTGGLATTGAVALIALGVAVVLVGAGVGLAAYRKKSLK